MLAGAPIVKRFSDEPVGRFRNSTKATPSASPRRLFGKAENMERMQRIRIGLTGLAFVFVLVLLATAVIRPSAEPPLTPNSVAGPGTAGSTANGVVDQPKEPLAELGVAPGNAEPDNRTRPNPPAPAALQR